MQFKHLRFVLRFSVCWLLLMTSVRLHAFALLGPFEPWMDQTNGFRQPGEIGGPMDIASGYRWNVPVVTYGFDQSFLDYFGSNGVTAVESAIQLLNNLPPASQLAPSNFPAVVTGANYVAAADALTDLKSETLFLLLEHLGLAAPDGSAFCLRSYSFVNGNIEGNVIMRNYDPVTFAASSSVDDTLLSYYLYEYDPGLGCWAAAPIQVDPNAEADPAVADGNVGRGYFYAGLTRDDIGGLRFLYSTNNVNYETLLPGVAGTGTNATSFVNGAWRPGVDKVLFVSGSLDPLTGEFFSPVTNQFTDTYITNGVVMHQYLARVISRPDVLFSAADLSQSVPSFSFYSCTGTTNWINNAAWNGNPSGAGPGVIQPPVVITFNQAGRQFVSYGSYSDTIAIDESRLLASFDGSTNAPIVYPNSQSGTGTTTVRIWLTIGNMQRSFDWEPPSTNGSTFVMQTSTDLAGWTNLFTVTNNGSLCTYSVNNPASSHRFYRLLPQ